MYFPILKQTISCTCIGKIQVFSLDSPTGNPKNISCGFIIVEQCSIMLRTLPSEGSDRAVQRRE